MPCGCRRRAPICHADPVLVVTPRAYGAMIRSLIRPAGLALTHDLGLERAVAVWENGQVHGPDIGQHGLGAGPRSGCSPTLPGRMVLLITQVPGHLLASARSRVKRWGADPCRAWRRSRPQ